MSSAPSTSVNRAPEADAMNRGVPPTERNARTGEFTPPGIASCARLKRSSERVTRPGYRPASDSALRDGHDVLSGLAEAPLPGCWAVGDHRTVMTAGALGVLGLLGGALLYRSARKRLSVRWIIMIVVVGALSGLLLGRAATLQPGNNTEMIQRVALAIVITSWCALVREILRQRRDQS